MSDWIDQHLDAELEPANKRGRAVRQQGPMAVSVGYQDGKVVVELDTGVEIRFAPAAAQGLENGTPEQLADVVIEQKGLGIHWPQLDADLYVPTLIRGLLGSKRWMAELGKIGGKASTPSKAAAARANGRLGGRPRKQSNLSKNHPST